MMYLPSKIRDWLHVKATARNIEDGEYLYALIRETAEKDGMECNHSPSRQVLHKKGNSVLGIAPIWRCQNCGMLYYKIKDGVNIPRIDKL